jgi:hypothetical protein
LTFTFLSLAVLALLVHACAEPEPQATTKDITGPQLAATASCAAPCVEVVVSVKGPGPAQSAEGIVVTLWRGGLPGDGTAFHALTDVDGVAAFDLTGEVGVDPVGFCAVARPLTSVADAETLVQVEPSTGTQLNIVPNAGGVNAPSASWQGSVSESANKSAVLNKTNLVKDCISWTTAAKAPFSVDQGTAIRVSMDMNAAAASISITCLFPDNTGENCQSWTAIQLDDVTIPWQIDLPPGVHTGFLASVGLGNSPAVNGGLAFGETYAVEVAQGEYSASKVITTSHAERVDGGHGRAGDDPLRRQRWGARLLRVLGRGDGRHGHPAAGARWLRQHRPAADRQVRSRSGQGRHLLRLPRPGR